MPIIGEKVDAHKFLEQVAVKGAGAVLTSEHKEKTAEMAETSCAWIAVDDTKKALQAVGRYLRKRLTLPIVGVTGSVGKTTTREMIAAALSARFHVYKTPGNSNSQVGVPITVSEITKEDEVGVLELGMSEPGELTVIARIAKPDVAVITNIGITHTGFIFFAVNIVSIGYFQSVERARPAMMVTVLRGFVFMVLCLLGLPLLLKVPGIWLAVPLAEILTFLVIMVIYYRKHQWVRR